MVCCIGKVAMEAHGTAAESALPQRVARLRREGVDAFARSATGVLLRPRKADKPPIFVLDGEAGQRARLLEDATRAFAPLDHTATVSRIYVPPEEVHRARSLLSDVWQQQSLLGGVDG